MKNFLALIAISAWLADAIPPPHPKVLAVRHEEQLLPGHLQSPALRNPHLREILPLTSLPHDGENIVTHRESDKVHRSEVYKMLIHAGFVPRRQHSPYLLTGNQHPGRFHHDPLTNASPEQLQHL